MKNIPRSLRVTLVVMGVVALGLFGFMVTLFWGGVSGEEFNPDTFTRRRFHYFELPILHIQISPIDRSEYTADLESYLLTKKYVAPATPPQTRWDLIVVKRGDRVVQEADANILCLYLDAKDDDGKFQWEQWSEQHPKLAAVFWKAVATAVRNRQYVRLPDLVRAALGAESDQALQTAVTPLISP